MNYYNEKKSLQYKYLTVKHTIECWILTEKNIIFILTLVFKLLKL